MVLTDRDKVLLEKLFSYAVMTTRQITKVVFADIQLTTVLRRLRKLEKHGYVRRYAGINTYECAWMLTERSALMLSDRPPKWHQSRTLIEHDTTLTALRMSLEEAGIARSWIPEHEIRAKVAARHGVESVKNRLIPDGIMGVQWQDFKESIAIELELHSKNASRYRNNFHDYKYKSSLLGVWYLTPTASLARHIEKLWRKEVSADRKPFFYWSLIDEVLEKTLNAEIHFNEQTQLLSNTWIPRIDESIAHTPAQCLSREVERKGDSEIRLSSKNFCENVIPTN